MGVCTKYCDRCVYRKNFTSGAVHYCDYLCMTGKRRPCQAGDGCTVRVTRMVYRKRELSEEEKAERLERRREQHGLEWDMFNPNDFCSYGERRTDA